eukprot:3610555-Heterocapsa_arctica.AAC.1
MFYASASDSNARIAELEAQLSASNADQTQLRVYIAEGVNNTILLKERVHQDSQTIIEKDR